MRLCLPQPAAATQREHVRSSVEAQRSVPLFHDPRPVAPVLHRREDDDPYPRETQRLPSGTITRLMPTMADAPVNHPVEQCGVLTPCCPDQIAGRLKYLSKFDSYFQGPLQLPASVSFNEPGSDSAPAIPSDHVKSEDSEAAFQPRSRQSVGDLQVLFNTRRHHAMRTTLGLGVSLGFSGAHQRSLQFCDANITPSKPLQTCSFLLLLLVEGQSTFAPAPP